MISFLLLFYYSTMYHVPCTMLRLENSQEYHLDRLCHLLRCWSITTTVTIYSYYYYYIILVIHDQICISDLTRSIRK